jgi:hypothetical protein
MCMHADLYIQTSAHAQYVCKLYRIILPHLGGHKSVELNHHKNRRLLEMIHIKTKTASLTLAKQHICLWKRDIHELQ